MYLLAGGDSEIGIAAAALLTARSEPFIVTSRRPGAALSLDLTRLDDFVVPEGVTAAGIFIGVARLAACAADPVGSRAVNVTGTLALVEKLVAAGVYTLFLSTNQVFDGLCQHELAEAPHTPVSAYGQQKAEAETALIARIADGAPIGILRLTKVVSPGMPLLTEWDRELRAGRPIRAFAEMRMAPVPAAVVAGAIAAMLEARPRVIAQLSGPRDISYLEAGKFLARRAGAHETLVEPGDVSIMPPGGLAPNTTLNSSYLVETFGIKVPDAFDVIDTALR